MIIKNASIYTENHTFVNGNAVVENGRFVSFSDFSVAGKIPRAFWEKKFYGYSQIAM